MKFKDQVENLNTNYSDEFNSSIKHDTIKSMKYIQNPKSLIIGYKNGYDIMNLSFPFGQNITFVNWTMSGKTMTDCLIKGDEEFECQNFIKVIDYDVKTDRLLICGTAGQDPKCRIYPKYPDLENIVNHTGKFICPFDANQKSTTLFADKGLYTSTTKDYNGNPIIARNSLNQDSITKLVTRERDAKWLNSPTFINSFEFKDVILFFFREQSVELTNYNRNGNNHEYVIYSRVSKVCKSDKGGDYILEEKWTTYQKTRLNCSFSGALPFYFNYLQDVEMIDNGNDKLFYSVFSTGEHEIPGSAVCIYNSSEIMKIFNEEKFLAQQSCHWYPLPRDMEVKPRVGNCSVDSKKSSDNNLEFITSHPMLAESAQHYGSVEPLFNITREDYMLTQIAVYNQMGKDNITYKVLYLGTNNGIVLKVVVIPEEITNIKTPKTNLLEKIYVTSPDKITGLNIIQTISKNETTRDMLIVMTNSSVIEIPLHRCNQYPSNCTCIQDPFCVWNNECKEFNITQLDENEIQDIQNIRECVTEVLTTEVLTTEVPTTEVPTTEVPTTEVPTTEVPTTEVPTTEVPTTEVPTTEVPTTEIPTTEVPTTEVPTTEVPTTEVPTTEVPTTEVPTTEVPTTEIPTTKKVLKTKVPTTKVPKTKVPKTKVQTTEVPTTEVPTTEVPTT